MWGSALFVALALFGPARHETPVERHHRKGVHCMDVIERSKCAIEQFELVLEEDTRERELVTDAMLRLIRLYRKSGDTDALKDVLRRYWDVGTRKQSRGHIPYGARFMPAELDVFYAVDIEAVREATITKATGDRTAEFVFTCDDEARANIQMTERWRRAKREAAQRGVKAQVVYYEEWDERRKRRAKAQKRREQREQQGDDVDEPIFSATTCTVAKALGFESLASWDGMAGAASHQDFTRSMFVADVPGADTRLAKAARTGKLEPVGLDHWVLTDETFADQPIHIARVDLDQILVAREDMIDPVLAAAAKGRRRMNRELERLAQQVPRDSAFYFVMTRAAITNMGFGGMKKGASGVLQALLPKPKGLQVAVAAHDEAGVFTRVPTDNPVKGRMLVGLARRMLEGEAAEDPEAAKWVDNLDIAEAGDRKALLAAYLIDAVRIREILYR